MAQAAILIRLDDAALGWIMASARILLGARSLGCAVSRRNVDEKKIVPDRQEGASPVIACRLTRKEPPGDGRGWIPIWMIGDGLRP
ncbi:hypothetical protein W911_16230 [Hyphomicrobium nitrativorans NL23]|uniref:Uncharacterized protein n=1 Tax=Hyphomicrobium nitrativorans NL23 TaxID=1029756 RepID=V5SHS6_9HYPH|nr:hypothetical protein W911_16230 [Hyphomicrobium nitrativorans NL23]